MPLDLSPLFSGGEQGFQYNFWDPANFRRSLNTAPVAANAPGDIAVFALDKHPVTGFTAEGSEMNLGTTASVSFGWSYSSGTITRTTSSTTAGAGVRLNLSTTLGAHDFCVVRFTVSGYGTDAINVRVGGSGTTFIQIGANGEFEAHNLPGGTAAWIEFVQNTTASTTATISNISVKKLAGRHAFRTATASNGFTACRAPNTVRQILGNSAFVGAIGGASAGTAPGGWTAASAAPAGTIAIETAPSYYGGNAAVITSAGGRAYWWRSHICEPSASYVASVVVDVITPNGMSPGQIIWLNGTFPSGMSAVTFYVNGVLTPSNTVLTAGTYVLEARWTMGTVSASLAINMGLGIQSAQTSGAQLRMYAPMWEKGTARGVYQRSSRTATGSLTTDTGDIFEPKPTGSNANDPNVPHHYYFVADSADNLVVPFSSSLSGTVMAFCRNGSWYEAISGTGTGNSAYSLQNTNSRSPQGMAMMGVVSQLGGLVGLVFVNRTLTADERNLAMSYYAEYGAKGWLASDGINRITNGDFASDVSGWTNSSAGGTTTWASGRLKLTSTNTSTFGAEQSVYTPIGTIHVLTGTIQRGSTTGSSLFMRVYEAANLATALVNPASASLPATASITQTSQIMFSGAVDSTASIATVMTATGAGEESFTDDVTLYRYYPAAVDATAATGTGSAAGQGFAPSASAGVDAATGTGTLAGEGLTPTVAEATSATAATGCGTLAGTGLAPTIGAGASAAPGLGTLAGAGQTPTVSAGAAVTPGPGALTGAGQAPAVAATTGAYVTPGQGALDGQGHAPVVDATSPAADLTASPGVGTLAGAGMAPTVLAGTGASAATGPGTLAGQGHAPVASAGVTAGPGVGSLTGAGRAPSVSAAATATPGQGTLAGVGLAPTASLAAFAAPGLGTLAGQGHAPAVAANANAAPGKGALSGQGIPPWATDGSNGAPPSSSYRVRKILGLGIGL